MGHSILVYEAPDPPHTLVGPADDEAVLHQPIQVRRYRGVDEGMAPAARVLLAVRDHDVLFGELPSLAVGVGDDQVTGQGPLGDRLTPARRPTVVEEPPLALEEALEVGGRPGDPVVGERRGAPERDVPPAADPDRRGGCFFGLWVDGPGGGGGGGFVVGSRLMSSEIHYPRVRTATHTQS